MTVLTSSSGLRALLASPAFLRLWSIGGCVNTMRWFEVLAAALFTLDATGSGFDVALVSAARTMPMFLLGAFSGVVTEAVNRKQVLVFGQILTCLASASVALLAGAGVARPWHVAVAASMAGVGLVHRDGDTAAAWSGSASRTRWYPGRWRWTRCRTRSPGLLGPVFAGVIYQRLGLAGTFRFPPASMRSPRYCGRVGNRQTTPAPGFRRVPRELAEGMRYVRPTS